MAVVFIHGVADTYRVWDRVREHLSRADVVTLALPGFDRPVPEGFAATKEEYVEWIIGELEKQDAPVDLVGHDWGCIFAARVASLRPDLVRTWAAGSGPVSARYNWHELAKIWQTPGDGERWMSEQTVDRFSKLVEGLGVPVNIARETAGRVDDRMKDCILRLYRSAITVGKEWEPGLAAVRSPGLVFWGTRDVACPVEFADELGAATKASRVLKLDCGHWTQIERSAEVARALAEHWHLAS